MPVVDGAAGECCLNQPLPVWAEPSDHGAAAEVTDMPSALQQLQVEVDALQPVEKRVGDAKARLRAMRSRRSTLEQQTQSIAEQLVAVRSGSALLEQLRQVTPQGVRLVSVDSNPSKLLIKGESQGTDAFQRINALDLNLEALPGMLLDGTTVVKAQADKQGRIAFSLEAKLDPAMKPTPEHLRGLGAEGLAQRLELLQGEGLFP